MPINHKYRFNIDKLRLCYNQPTELFSQFAEIKPNTYWDRGDYKLHILGDEVEETPHQIQVNVLLNNNTLLGYFVFNNSKRYEGFCFFTFSNSALYEFLTTDGTNKYNLITLIDYIANDLNLTLNNITEVEISLDTTINVNAKIRKLIKDYNNFDMIQNGRKVKDPSRKLENYCETFSRSRKRLLPQPTLYFEQTKKDAPLLRIYNKTEEIKSNGNEKEYITEWNQFGKTSTYRMELRLKNESIKEFLKTYHTDRPLLDFIQDPEVREALWAFFADRLIYFRADDGTPIRLIDLITP